MADEVLNYLRAFPLPLKQAKLTVEEFDRLL